MSEPIFSGRCVRCGLALSTDDEFTTVEQFAQMWLKVHTCQGTRVPVAVQPAVGSFEQAAAKHNADTAAFHAATEAQPQSATRIDAKCPRCAALGVKSKKGYAPKFWPKENGPDQCDGIDGSGQYMNHRREAVTA